METLLYALYVYYTHFVSKLLEHISLTDLCWICVIVFFFFFSFQPEFWDRIGVLGCSMFFKSIPK